MCDWSQLAWAALLAFFVGFPLGSLFQIWLELSERKPDTAWQRQRTSEGLEHD
jgi:hypothetical protein